MKERATRDMATSIAALALLAVLSPAFAEQGMTSTARSSPCTNAALNGRYGFLRIGHTNQGTLTAIGAITFDGQGNTSGAGQTFDRNGMFSDSVPGVGGRYSVNPDCTGTQIDSTGFVFAQLAVIHNGSEGLAMSLVAGNNVAVHYERITDQLNPDSDGGCSNATLNGVYGIQRNGQIPGGNLTAVGTATFDGEGNIVTNETVGSAGTFSPVTNRRFTYSINADCRGTQTSENGDSALLIAVHDGGQVLGMSLIPGTNVALHYERAADPPAHPLNPRVCREFDRTP